MSETFKGDGKLGQQEHYARSGIEPIEAIEAWSCDFFLGNALKYIVRAGYKDSESKSKDLTKALWYLRRRVASAAVLGKYVKGTRDHVFLDRALVAWKLSPNLSDAVVAMHDSLSLYYGLERISLAADLVAKELELL